MKDHITILYILSALNFGASAIVIYTIKRAIKIIVKAIKEEKEREENGKV